MGVLMKCHQTKFYLRQHRENLNYDPYQIAYQLNISHDEYTEYEDDSTGAIPYDILCALVDIFEVESINDLKHAPNIFLEKENRVNYKERCRELEKELTELKISFFNRYNTLLDDLEYYKKVYLRESV